MDFLNTNRFARPNSPKTRHIQRKRRLATFSPVEPLECRTLLSAYAVIDLGTLGGAESFAYGINASSQVVGQSQISGNAASHAFLYSNGTMTDLGTLGGSYSQAKGIDGSGRVVGWTATATGVDAFMYSNGSMVDLGTLGGSYSQANGINGSGQVVGYSEVNRPINALAFTLADNAFLYSGGAMSSLGTFSDGANSVATGINAAGQVVGYADRGPADHAFLYSGGSMTDLGTFSDGTDSAAAGINDSGQVVGYANHVGSYTHAFLYSGGSAIDLGSLNGTDSYAAAINSAGEVVGRSNSGAARAFLYRSGVMQDLNSLIPPNSGWVLEEANAINDAGQIAGVGMHNGVTRAFLLSPQASTGTSVSAVSAGYGDANVSLAATVSAANSAAVDEGVVTFTLSENGQTIGSITSGVGSAGTTTAEFPLNGLDAGSYAIQASYTDPGAAAAFSGSSGSATLTVNPAHLTVAANSNSKVYGQTATDSGTVSGIENGDTITATFSSIGDPASAGAGAYPVAAVLSDGGTGKLALDYSVGDLSDLATLTVSPAPLTIAADAKQMVFAQPVPVLTASYNGFVNGDAPASLTTAASLSTTASSSSPVGYYSIRVGGASSPNYTITFVPGQLQIIDENLQGMVWVDFNNDGNVDFGESGIGGVLVTLSNWAGQMVAQTTTDANGLYTFNHVLPDTYTITEGANPAGYVEGKDSLGAITDPNGNVIGVGVGNNSVQDVFSAVPIAADQNAINYNFGEQPAPGSAVSKGQAAGIGFWQNKNGQALIQKFASIGPWLAATLPQTFGGLAGASPQQVAMSYQQQFVLKDKMSAQFMATALNVYATDASLGGSYSSA